MSDSTFTTSLRIDATHPALPGHFPGNPIVPGVVLLQRVAAALEQWRGEKLASFDVKFLSPLLPEQKAQIELREDSACVRFAIRCDEKILARGTLTGAP